MRQQDVRFLIGHDFVVNLENLPADLPVLEAEIAVLETYLEDIVDEIFTEIERERRTAQRRGGSGG